MPPRGANLRWRGRTRLELVDMSNSTPRRPISKALRFAVLERDEFRCQYCGAAPKNGALEVDHIIPVSKGGETSAENLITSCEPCNKGKSNKHVKAAPVPDMSEMAAAYEAKRKAIEKWRREHDRMDEVIESVVSEMRRYVSVAEHVLASAIREYGVDEVAYAVEAVQVKGIPRGEYENQTKYLYGVLRNRAGQGYNAPRDVKIPRSNCPYDFGKCWIGNGDTDGKRGDVDGCLVKTDDGYSCCSPLIQALGGWTDDEWQIWVIQILARFAIEWRKSGTDAALTLYELIYDQMGVCSEDGLRDGEYEGIRRSLLNPDDELVNEIRKRLNSRAILAPASGGAK